MVKKSFKQSSVRLERVLKFKSVRQRRNKKVARGETSGRLPPFPRVEDAAQSIWRSLQSANLHKLIPRRCTSGYLLSAALRQKAIPQHALTLFRAPRISPRISFARSRESSL